MHRVSKKRQFEIRYMAIWLALVLLVLLAALSVPRILLPSSLSSVVPLAAFLAIAAMGQTLVIMTAGIDLSIPAVITMGGFMVLKVSGGADANLPVALAVALSVASAIGLTNGLLVTFFRLNPLVVTLAVGTVVTGVSYWFRGTLLPESRVPSVFATWASKKIFVFNSFSFVAFCLIVFFWFILNRTTVGRRFVAAGTNPNAAALVGIPVKRYQIGAYTVAGFLYGVTGVLLAAFVRSPGLDLGNPYLLSTVVVVVLGGAFLSGGPASMIATLGAAMFLIFLNHMLRAMGLPTSIQSVIQGVVLVCAMAIPNLRGMQLKSWRIFGGFRLQTPDRSGGL